MLLGAALFKFAWHAQHAGLGAPQARFAWQVQHSEHLRLVLRGRCSGSPATSDAFGRRLVLRRRRSARSTSGSFCVAGAALGAPQARFCVAAAALGAPQARFAWQVQHFEHLGSFCIACAALAASQLRSAGHFCKAQTIHTTPCTLHHQTHHHQDNNISTTSSTQSHQSSTQPHEHSTIYTTPPTQHHLRYIINTTPSTLHHQTQHHQQTPSILHQQHHIINTTSSTHHHLHSQHHLHNAIHTTPSTLHHQTLAGAALGTLPSYPFCLIPADFPLCFSSLWIVPCVKWLQPAMRGASCVRRVRFGSFWPRLVPPLCSATSDCSCL